MLEGLARLRELTGTDDWIWKNAEILVVEAEIDAAAARPWLPWPLRLQKPARAVVMVMDYPFTSFGSVYKEAAVLLPVRFGPVNAMFCPWMTVDDDRALVLGRECLGFPKKMARMEWRKTRNLIRAGVTRRDVKLVEVRGEFGGLERNPGPVFARRAVNVFGPVSLFPQSLLCFKPREQILESRELVNTTLTMNGSESDPLDQLGFGRVLGARLVTMDFGGSGLPPVPIWPVGPLFMLRNWNLRYH